jgi:hypothetical protein
MTLVERFSARSPVQRRVLAVVMLVVALGLIWEAILVPLVWVVGSQNEWRTDVRHNLARALGRAASEPALRHRAKSLSSEPVWRGFYDAPKGQDATALVQRDVMNVGTVTGVKVQVVTPVPKVEEAGLTGYGVRFTTTLSVDQLKKFMDALRANAGYLRVERLTITAPQVQRSDQNASLTVTMEVYGFSRASS